MNTTLNTPQPPASAAATPPTSVVPAGKPDKYIWAVYIFLCIVSVLEIYSASSREVTANNIFGPIIRQCIHLAIDTVIVLVVSRIHYRYFKSAIPLFIAVSVAMMAYVLVNGEIINGARRSLTIFGFQMQPSEMIKMSAVLGVALVMSLSQMPRGVTNRGVIVSAAIVIFCGGLLFSQGLTNTTLLMAISLSMMLIAGIQLKKFLIVCIVYALAAGGGFLYKMRDKDNQDKELTEQVAAVTVKKDDEKTQNRLGTWQERIARYMGDSIPLYDQPITTKNRQEVYGYMAQAHGGVFGVLPGNSRETSRLPLAFSDYIYSIVVEDWGFVGGMFLLIAYLSLLARAGNIATRCSRVFPALLVLGMAVMIAFQALFHMAIVTGVFPVSGQPLPMISKGGSSMMVTALAFGIMLSVSRFAVRNGKKEDIKREKEALPESLRADNPTQL